MTMRWRSARVRYISLALLTILAGLVIHLRGSGIAAAPRDILGDALWAAMIVWLVSAIIPQVVLIARSAIAYAICVLVELSQLYHAPAVDTMRATGVGRLVLGSGFDPRDFGAYAAGVACAALCARVLFGSRAA